MTNTNTAHTATFRKMNTGLYGTGQIRSIYANEETGCHYLRCECKTVEKVIDARTSIGRGWDIRWVCECGHFTDLLGEWYPTLAAAKQAIR
jgi:hypothetical protein